MQGKAKKIIQHAQQKTVAEIPAGKKEIVSGIPVWAPVAVIVLTALLYSRAVFNGFTSFDDDVYILTDPFIRNFSWDGIKAIFSSFYVGNYHPFTLLAYLFEYTCFGANPLPYHLVNVSLHLANTWLVYKLAEQLSGKRITALVVCILFALHPMHVESVAWASEQKDVLYALFYLLSLIYYLRYIGSGYLSKYYILVLVFFIASLFSKSAAVTLPVLLIGIDAYKGRIINARSLLEKAPFLLLSLVFGVLNLFAQNADGALTNLSKTYNVFNRVVLMASSLTIYLLKLVAPFSLSAMHFFPRLHGNMLPGQYYTSLPFLLFIVMLVVLVRRSSFRKEVLFGIAFFLVTISVMLQIIAVGSMLISERYTYIPYIGLFYIIGQWVASIDIEKHKPVVIGVFSLVVIICTIQTWTRIGVWKNDTTLYTDIRAKDPKTSDDMAYGFTIKGNTQKNAGELTDAMKDYSQAILLNPVFYEAYCNRGYVYQKLGNSEAALLDFNKAIQLRPELAEGYNNRGSVYFQMRDIKTAMADFNKAISLKPGFAEGYANRGAAYFGIQDTRSAMDDYNKAISLDPRYAEAYNSRGWLYLTTGNTLAAMNDFNKAIELKPDLAEAYCNRGVAYTRQLDTKAAILEYTTAISKNPRYAMAYNMRGSAYLGQNDPKAAISDYSQAISIDSTFADAYSNRGWVYLGMGDSKAAMADYSKAISLNPKNALAYNNRATIKANTGDLQGALEDYNVFLQLQPTDNTAYNDRGTVRFNLKDIPGACGDWKKAAELGNKTAAETVRTLCH